MSKRIWPLGQPFVPVTVERPHPLRGPSLWHRGKALVSGLRRQIESLRLDGQLEAAGRQSWAFGRLIRIDEQELSWTTGAETFRLRRQLEEHRAAKAAADVRIQTVRRRQRILENEARG